MNDSVPVPTVDRDPAPHILAAVHPVCSHDLPNQMVSLHSLLHLLEMEEVDRLSNDGREYLHRLHRVAEKTAVLVDFLKEAVRLTACVPKPSRVDLRELLEELRVESRTFLEGEPAWSAGITTPVLVTDETLLLRALEDCVKGLAGRAKVAAVRWECRVDGAGPILDVCMKFASPVPNPWTDSRLDLTLAGARLHRLGIGFAPLDSETANCAGARLRFASEAS